MKKTISLFMAALVAVSCFSFGSQASFRKYALSGMDADYYTLLDANDEAMLLGSLSAKYESNGDPSTISDNKDTGGVSYGAYQFASNYGVPLAFVNWCISSGEGVEAGKKLKAAYELDGNKYGKNFNAEWKAIAQASPEGFLLLQHNYTKACFYDVVVQKLEKNIKGFDIDNYTIALKNVIWSRAVQNGVNSDVITKAFESLGGFNNQPEDILIKAIYARASLLVDQAPYSNSVKITKSSAEKYGIDVETVEGKYLFYFSKNTSDIQVSVYRRLAIRELADALEMYVNAGGVLTPDEPVPDEPIPDEPTTDNPGNPPESDSNTGNDGDGAGDQGGDAEQPAQSTGIMAFFEAVLDFFAMILDFLMSLIA